MEHDARGPDPEEARKVLGDDLQARLKSWVRDDRRAEPERPTDVMDFVSWMLQSARLAALGDDLLLRQWPRVASVLGLDVQKGIAVAASAGMQRIESMTGRRLGEEIGVAEDASCLGIMEARTTDLLGSTLAGRWLGAWIDAASHIPLDEEGVQVLLERRRRWPLPEAIRLPAVQFPLSEMDLVVGASPSPPPTRLVPQFSHVEEAALFDDGRPTPGMIRRFATRRGAGSTRSGRWLRADAELDPYWQVTLGLQAPGVGVRSVRLGPMAMIPHPDASGAGVDDEGNSLWSTSLKDLPLAVRTRVVCGEISILTNEGDRFLV